MKFVKIIAVVAAAVGFVSCGSGSGSGSSATQEVSQAEYQPPTK